MNSMAAQLDERIKSTVRQRKELEAVLSSMVEGVLAVNMDEQVISINQAAAHMLDREPGDIVGRSIQETIRNPICKSL